MKKPRLLDEPDHVKLRRSLGALLGVVVVGLASGACDRTSSRTVGRLTVEGRAEVVTVEGDLRDVTGSRTLKSGEQVTLVEGSGILSLGEGRHLELRKGTVIRLALQPAPSGQNQPQGELVTGDVLVVSPESDAVVLAGDSVVTVSSGTARVSRGLAVVTGVYQGAAGIETAGRSVSIDNLRQVTVPAPGLPSRPTPLSFSASDPWDQRFLGDAIDLGNRLVATSRGFSDQLPPGEGRTVGFFQQLLPALASQDGFNASLLDPDRPPGETLVGAAITLQGTRSTFTERWDNVFRFHDEGAPWGLVALDQGVSRGPLLTTIDGAVSRLLGLANQAAPAPPAAPSGSGPGARPSTAVPVPTAPARGSSSTPAGSGGTTAGGGTSSPAATTAPAGSNPSTGSGTSATPATPDQLGRGPLNLGVPLVDNTVNSVVETLSGLLRALGSE